MTAPLTQTPPCPKCGGNMWDNRTTKRSPKAPDYKCRNTSCDGVVWPPKNGQSAPHAKPATQKQPYNAGPYVPAIDGDVNPYATTEAAPAVDPAKAMLSLYRDCFAEAMRMVKALNADEKTDLGFTSDNVCSMAAVLYIEANKRGLRSLAA